MNPIHLPAFRRRAPRLCATMLGAALLASAPAAHAQFYTFDETVEPVEPGVFNPWDFSFQDVTIGFGVDNEATVTILPGGELLAQLLFLGVGDETASGFLNISGVDGEGRPATFLQAPMETGSDTYVGFDGHGEVMVSDGGLFSTRVNYTAFNPGSTGKITVTGPDSVWDVNNVTLRVGQQGHAVLHVLDGARVENATNMFLGNSSVMDEGTGEVIGGGSVEILIEGGASVTGSGNTRIANLDSTTADMTIRGAGSLFEVESFAHIGSGGEANLLIEDGGRFIAGGTLTVAAGVNSGRRNAVGHVHVTGAGSLIESGSWFYVGRGGNDTDEDGNIVDLWGTSGTLLVENGGAVVSGTSFRLAREAEGFGEATFTGEGTTLITGGLINVAEEGVGIMHVLDGATVDQTGSNFFQVGREPGSVGTLNVSGGSHVQAEGFLYAGREGDGTINVTGGGTINHGGVLYVAREDTAVGHVLVSGENSRIHAGSDARIGATPSLEPTGGIATIEISDGGVIATDANFVLRGDSTVTLDGGTIELVADDETGETGEVSIETPSILTGAGTIDGRLAVGTGALVQGTGNGITVTGALSGTGTVENLNLGVVQALTSEDTLTLNNTGFLEGAALNIVVDASTEGTITADAATDFSNANLTVTFEPFEPGTSATFQLFTGEAALTFASMSLPSGWELTGEGVLQHTGADPDPDGAFADWAASFGLSGADAETGANPAGDGFTNTQKFAFGIDPTVAVAALAEVEGDADTVTLRWNQLDGSGVTYVIESRSSLTDGEWTEVEGATPVAVGGAPDGYTRFEWTTSVSGGEGQAFYRARAVVEAALLP